MNKLIFAIILSTLSFSCLSKTVKDNENTRSQNVVALFNKVCMEAYLDEDKLNNFLLNNNFEDLNDETIIENKDSQNSKSNNELNKKQSQGLVLSATGKHYSIENEKKVFFLDIGDETCSILVKSINQDIFNNQFKDFRKGLTTESFTEISKSLEKRNGSTNYKLTSYYYFDKEDNQQLPFELYVTQTNTKKTTYQLKLTVHLDKRKEILENKQKSKNDFTNITFKTNSKS